MLLVAVVCVCAMDGEDAVCLTEERDRARLVVSVPTFQEDLLALSSSFCFSFSFNFSRTSMVARNGFPSAVKRLNLVVTRLGLVYFFILEVVVFGLVPVDLWTVLCVAAGFEIVGASCKGVVVAGLGGDILESVLEDGGAIGICFSGVIDVAKVREQEGQPLC